MLLIASWVPATTTRPVCEPDGVGLGSVEIGVGPVGAGDSPQPQTDQRACVGAHEAPRKRQLPRGG